MECGRDLAGMVNGDRHFNKMGIQCVHDPIGIKLVRHIQMRNLTGGMHTRIGTSGPGNCRRGTDKGCGGFFYGRLN